MSDSQQRDTIATDPEEALELLKRNYDHLHQAVWDCHKLFWTVTSIYIPVVFTAVGLFLKGLGALTFFQAVAGAVLIAVVVWFWCAVFFLCRRYNKARGAQLRRIEEGFNRYMGGDRPGSPWPEFLQAKLDYSSPGRQGRRGGKLRLDTFRAAVLGFALLVTAILVFLILLKAFDPHLSPSA